MRILLKSKLYQQEIQRFTTILALLVWGLIATIFAVQNRRELVLIGIDSRGNTRLIQAQDDKFIQEELKTFLREFIEHLYFYNQESFEKRIAFATDQMSQELWSEQRNKLADLDKHLKSEPLDQTGVIESLDLMPDGKVEAVLKIQVRQRLNERSIRLKVLMTFKAKDPSPTNPWGYEVTELQDAVL